MIREREPIGFVIPTYNAAKVVVQAVSSIFTQNYQPGDEVILIDDASTDNTVDTLAALARDFPAVRVLRHRHNMGTAAAARNTGIEDSGLDLLFCLDSDNLLEPNSIGPLYERMRSEGADAAAFGEIHYFQTDIRQITHKWIYSEEVTLADALAGVVWPGPSGNYLFTRESWLRAGRYHEPYLENRSLDSWTFGIRQLGTGSRFVTLPGSWYYHRYGHESHYVRNWQRGNQSLSALMGLMPFLELLEDEDVEYLFSREGRLDWYEHLQEHPIRVKNQHRGQSGVVEHAKLPLNWSARQWAGSTLEAVARKLRSWGNS